MCARSLCDPVAVRLEPRRARKRRMRLGGHAAVLRLQHARRCVAVGSRVLCLRLSTLAATYPGWGLGQVGRVGEMEAFRAFSALAT
eukprot:2601763-Prymnesium_polylepis.1